MMGQQNRTESLFYYFRLEEQIPADHLLRMIDGHGDFSFVREQLKDSLGQGMVSLSFEQQSSNSGVVPTA